MKKLFFVTFVLSNMLLFSCEKCYECSVGKNAAKPIDICGKGVELDDTKNLVEAAGYSCIKK